MCPSGRTGDFSQPSCTGTFCRKNVPTGISLTNHLSFGMIERYFDKKRHRSLFRQARVRGRPFCPGMNEKGGRACLRMYWNSLARRSAARMKTRAHCGNVFFRLASGNQANAVGAHPFTAAGKAQLLLGGRLDVDLFCIDLAGIGNVFCHL